MATCANSETCVQVSRALYSRLEAETGQPTDSAIGFIEAHPTGPARGLPARLAHSLRA